MLKAISELPRVSLASQLSAADLAIIFLFALAGFTGFPGFTKYSDIKNQIANLTYKPAWALLLFVFGFLVIYRKIRKCYFSIWLARLHAILIHAVVTAAIIIVARFSFLSSVSLLDTFIAVQSGLAALYLVVQGWVDFKPDLGGLAISAKQIDRETASLERQYGEALQRQDIDRLRDMSNKFASELEAARVQCLDDRIAQRKIITQQSKIDRILEALKAPLPQVPQAIQRARETS